MVRLQAIESSEFFSVLGLTNRLTSFIRHSIPVKFRKWENGTWCVHVSKVYDVVQFAYEDTGYVNYSCLPPYLVSNIEADKKHWKQGSVRKEGKYSAVLDNGYYARLYLLPSAPLHVVKASYKALSKAHHPDAGGDQEEFMKVQEAYTHILREREK